MNKLKSLAGIAASLLIVTSLAPTLTAQVVTISDFDTINPVAAFDMSLIPQFAATGDASWVGDIFIENGHQSVGFDTALHTGGALANLGLLNLTAGGNTALALTASSMDGFRDGSYIVVLGSGPNNASAWLFSPLAFPDVLSFDSADPVGFGTVTLPFTSRFTPTGYAGPADLSAITGLIMTGDQTATILSARFDHLAAVPEPSQYGIMAGLGLIGFAFYRRFAGKSATVQA